MTKSDVHQGRAAAAPAREPRPFLFLEPQRVTSQSAAFAPPDVAYLDAAATDSVPALVRAIVGFTIALQNRRALEHGDVHPIQLSVLNRRRRAARAWLVAILAGRTDASTQHAVATQWLPTLCGTGPDVAACSAPASRLVEFVRGAVTACLFDAPSDNLLPHAKALFVLEQTLAIHLGAVRNAARRGEPVRA